MKQFESQENPIKLMTNEIFCLIIRKIGHCQKTL